MQIPTRPDGGENDPVAEATPDERQPAFNLHRAVVILVALCVAIHLMRIYGLSEPADAGVIYRFAFLPFRWSADYGFDIYSLTSGFSYAFLHGDFAHLAVNMVWLCAFGSPLAARIGTVRFIVFWVITSLLSAAFFWLFHRTGPAALIGASGAISAITAAAARFGFRVSRAGGTGGFSGPPLPLRAVFANRTTLSFIAVWFVVNLVAGLGSAGSLAPGYGGVNPIAWEAHIGGFLAGFLLAPLFVSGE